MERVVSNLHPGFAKDGQLREMPTVGVSQTMPDPLQMAWRPSPKLNKGDIPDSIFTYNETGIPRGQVICLKSHRQQVVGLGYGS